MKMASKGMILVVEDDASSAEMLTEMFLMEDYEVKRAATLEEAIEAMSCQHFHAALLDLTLPGVTTDDLIERIRQVPEKPPLIIFSARMAEDLRSAADRLGAVAVLQKPARIDVLMSTMERVLRAT